MYCNSSRFFSLSSCSFCLRARSSFSASARSWIRLSSNQKQNATYGRWHTGQLSITALVLLLILLRIFRTNLLPWLCSYPHRLSLLCSQMLSHHRHSLHTSGTHTQQCQDLPLFLPGVPLVPVVVMLQPPPQKVSWSPNSSFSCLRPYFGRQLHRIQNVDSCVNQIRNER